MTTKLFDKNGVETHDEKGACAKIVESAAQNAILGPTGTVTTYYVKHSGYLYDPVQMTAVDERNRNWKMRRVAQPAFDSYLNFLKTKKETFLINAERLINGQS